MKAEPISLREIRERAERIVFERGGWLQVANRMGLTGETLRRRFAPSAPQSQARETLAALERMGDQ
jgi:hypothetical protein